MPGGSQDTIEMLSAALQMERKGEEFYSETVKKTKNPVGKQVWEMLRADELVHMRRIKKIYESLSEGKPWSEEWFSEETQRADIDRFFGDLAKKHEKDISAETTDLQAIDVGIELELQAVNYYEKHFKKAVDPLEKKFLGRMMDEEKSHYLALSDMKLYLVDPVGWFRDKERTHLDGYT